MKRKIIILFLMFSIMSILSAEETWGSFRNRIDRMPTEWNQLIEMQEKLRKEENYNAVWHIESYKLGFAEAMYRACEDIYDYFYTADDWYIKQYEFYFNQYQSIKKDFEDSYYLFYDSDYAAAGFNRVQKGSYRYGIYDF